MIAKIRDRLIYLDPADVDTQFQLERRRIQQHEFDQRVRTHGLIPSISGPPPHLYGQHLPTAPDPEDEDPKKKKEKGVWYVPWYEDEDSINPNALDTLALSSMDEVLQSLSRPNIIWDIQKPKGKKSREHFSVYMQMVGVAMWREKKSTEDDTLFGNHVPTSKAMSGLTNRGRHPPVGSMHTETGGRLRGDGNSIGGPRNSANVLGRGRGRGRGERGLR